MREASDLAPEWQCPKCEVAYNKVELQQSDKANVYSTQIYSADAIVTDASNSALSRTLYGLVLVSFGIAAGVYLSSTQTLNPVQTTVQGDASVAPIAPSVAVKTTNSNLVEDRSSLSANATGTGMFAQTSTRVSAIAPAPSSRAVEPQIRPPNLVELSRQEFEKANNYYSGLNGYRKNIRQAEYWYQKAAEKGHWAAGRRLATIRAAKVPQRTGNASSNNPISLYSNLLSSAQSGDVNAQYAVGVMLQNGNGVSRNLKEANRWYLSAAKSGHERAQFNIALAYMEGRGIERDVNQAIRWYRHVAGSGNIAAMNNLGVIYNNGLMGQRNYSEAHKWYAKAARAGEPYAQSNLGNIYRHGRGVEKDYVEAYAWYTVASYNGQEGIPEKIADFKRYMSDDQVEEAKTKSRIYINRYRK